MTLTSYILRRYLGEMSIPFIEKHSIYGKELLLNYEEVQNILEERNCNFLRYFYFNKENIHDILYQENKIISVDNILSKSLHELFYLDLLIMDRPNIINYVFSKDTLISLCEELSKVKKGPKKIVMAKIIYDLIESFKGFGDYDEKINEISLVKLSNLCVKEIKNEIKNDEVFWNEIDADNILIMNIDQLYSKIINKLFKYDLYENEEFVFDILHDLEIKSIKINEIIYSELIYFLNNDENYRKEIFIENIEDLNNIKKINLYYIILNYILKNSFYIYNTDFLKKARGTIIHFIKKYLYILLLITTDLSKDSKEKLDFIIKALTDTNYFYSKYTEIKNDKKINTLIEDKRFKYTFPLMEILLDLKIDDIKIEEKEELDKIIKRWDLFYNLIKEAKFKKLPLHKRKILYSYLKDKNNKIILLKLFNKEQYDLFQKLEINDTKEYIIIKNIDDNNNNSNKINEHEPNHLIIEKENVQNNEQDSKKSETTSIIIGSYTIPDVAESQVEFEMEKLDINSKQFDFNMFMKSNKYKIIEYNKTLEKNEKFNKPYLYYTRNMSNGHYIIAGNSHKIMLYNSYFEKKLEIYLDLMPKNIYEIKNNNKYEIPLMASCGNELNLITIELPNYSYNIKTKLINRDIYFNYFNTLGDEYLISGLKGVFVLNEDKNDLRANKVLETDYINGINITEKIFAFISNDLLPKGENKLLIYNFKKNGTIKEINNYPFKISNNSLYSINLKTINSIDIDRKILFSSCVSTDKNGFLFVDINLKKNTFVESFYETKEFEPNCFCQISIVDNNNSINDDIAKEKNIEIKETEYFLVGGFEPIKRMGSVKLYKIKYCSKNDKINIRYLFDIATEDVDQFKGFNTDVTCITQSKITGNLLISCLDGNTYLFKPPNLEIFL